MYQRTKIVATIGPASSSKEIMEQMIKAGVDVCRINASHGTNDQHQIIIDNIKSINKENNCYIAILYDLQGPKIRTGLIKNDLINLPDGEELIITTKECIGDEKKIYIAYKQFPADVSTGDTILIDDGKIKLVVKETNKKDIVKAIIIHGGNLSSRKGVNLPNTKISLPSLTEKDLKNLEFALANDVEWIGLSFVRSTKDVLDLKNIIKKADKNTLVIAKIEKPEAISDIDNIIEAADGIMVARGDLGVELPMDEVPLIQKMLISKSINASKPVIIATQMMESMVNNFSPTRAEVNDVANSVLDGADALMLSSETAMGKHPIKVVEHMQKIIETVENKSYIYYREHPPRIGSQTFIADSISYNACKMSEQAGAKGIITLTHSGSTAFKIASHRPKANIFIFTDNLPLLNTLNLLWGVRSFYYNDYESTDKTIEELLLILKQHKYLKEGDVIINIASVPITKRGRANMIKLSYVE